MNNKVLAGILGTAFVGLTVRGIIAVKKRREQIKEGFVANESENETKSAE